MSEELADQFRDTLGSVCRQHQENQTTIRDYSMNAFPSEDSLQFISLNEYSGTRERVDSALAPASLTVFRNEARVRNNLKFYALVARFGENDSLVGFRWLTPAQKPDRGKWRVTAIRNQTMERYERVVQDLLLFDAQLDCLLYKDAVFILNRDKFEKIFNFEHVIREAASAALYRLGQEVTIQNFEEFQATCLRSRDKQRKLEAVVNKVDLSKLTIDSAEQVRAENPRLNSIIGSDDNGSPVLSYDRSNPWALLRYLSLSTGRSVATGDTIEAHNHDIL